MLEELIEQIANSHCWLTTQLAKREQLPYLRFCKGLQDIKWTDKTTRILFLSA